MCDGRGPGSAPDDSIPAKEEHYKLLNAELEAKNADIIRQADLLLKEQNTLFSKPLSTVKLTDFEEDGRIMTTLHDSSEKPHIKVKTKHQATFKAIHSGKQPKDKTIRSKISSGNYLVALEEEAGTFLSKTILNMEEKMNEEQFSDPFFIETKTPDVSDAQMRVLKAKFRIMQEELDQLTSEYYKKDDENIRLNSKIKELEEERSKLQKSESILKTQIEKHKVLVETSDKKCEGLQMHIVELNKEIESLNRSSKQTATLHNNVEIRLNRATEESQRLKSELNKIKQMNKDKSDEQYQGRENLQAENKNLKKQKAELVIGFKKQLKLIDILKRQRMHFEASKLLSFTEEEFMKALDWGEL
uniref:Testis expressed 9 n=1 Tax=Knipowitschia caucasica TaxID=637954 RepID=A0AAV2LUL8_KNICA